MILIVCLDDDNGMMFNHRRQSQDKELRRHLIAITAGKQLWMNSYSAKQFEADDVSIKVEEAFMTEAADGEYCFAEDIDALRYENRIERIIVYRWNRKYPSDLRFNLSLTDGHWHIKSAEDFTGFSHEKITMEVYEK